MDRDFKGRFSAGNAAMPRYSLEERNLLLERYCEHRGKGRSKESFIGCHYETLERWIKGSEYWTIRARDSEAKGHLFWETLLFNVGFGIPTEIPYPTKDEPERTFLITHQNARPHILIFIMKAKFPETYGNKIRIDSNGSLEQKSKPFQIIDSNE